MGNDQLAKTIFVDVTARSQECCSFPIQEKPAYASQENFVGRVIDGYALNLCVLI